MKKHTKTIICLTVLSIASTMLYLLFGLKGKWNFALELRSTKLLAITVVACCVGYSSVAFQTITNNKILTPSIMGFEAVYLLLQSTLVFIFSDQTFKILNSFQNFSVSIVCMIGFAILIYLLIYNKAKTNIYMLVLIGILFGMMMDSFTSFIQLLIDPNDFFILQGKMFASINKVNQEVLIYAVLFLIPTMIYGFKLNRKLDVLLLGRENAISLGINYNLTVRLILVVIAVLVSLSTALIGPLGFLGLLMANLTYAVTKTFKHNIVITVCCTITFITMVLGQFIMEHFLNLKTPLSTIINFVGGIYFLVIILKSKIYD